VECHAPSRALRDALRDAVGWTRVLFGADPRVSSSCVEGSASGGRGLALLEAPDGIPASVIAAATPGAPPLGRVRATRLGETLVEVDGDEHQQRIEVADAAGRRVLPRLFESPERVALRRAVAAVLAGQATRDVVEFARDDALAAALGAVATA
jgi:hypothetical protein